MSLNNNEILDEILIRLKDKYKGERLGGIDDFYVR